MTVLDVLLLGSVVARVGDRDCSVSGAKQRVLLARLAVAQGRAVYREQLLADLWGEKRPRDPAHALQAQVSRLRSALPVEIALVNGGYCIDPTEFQTDVARFESLCDQGGWLIADGAIAPAAGCLRAALDLWRGPALADLPAVPALQAESVRLEKLRATALADRIDADLALGATDAVVAELHALIRAQPFRERYWGQLMTALYGSGRAHEALEVFSDARQMFVETLGVEPSGELGQLHVKILREESPKSLLRLSVRAPEFGVPNDAGQRLTEQSHQTRQHQPVTSNRPGALVALMRSHQAIVLTGPAGIGKTHLLRTVAADFEAQRWFAPLLFASALGKSIPLGAFLGIVESTQGDITPGTLIDYFARRRSRAILLVDDVAQLDDASLFVVTHLIRTAGIPAVMTVRDLAAGPAEIQSMYDGGQLTEVALTGLNDVGVGELVSRMAGGPLAPGTSPRLLEVTGGNPLHLREIVTGSLRDGRLVSTQHGWELRGLPAPTQRLARLLGERFDDLDSAALEAAARVAIAGEYPAAALDDAVRRGLARAAVVEYGDPGWLRLSQPLDGEVLRRRCSEALWSELTDEVVRELRGKAADSRPEARRRAHVLALETGGEIDVQATIALAEHALGSFDERLALRAAEAALARASTSVDAHRIAGQAAAALGDADSADAHLTAAQQHASTDAEKTAVALARSSLAGLRHHDAAGAVKIIEETLAEVDGLDDVAHLQRARTRWAAVAGQGGELANAPAVASDVATAQGLITVGMSGVITGPLEDAHRVLFRLRHTPGELIDLVPGGAALIELTEIMALSNTGDVVATRRRLQDKIVAAQAEAPETLGMWEYALGFSHLLSGDSSAAYALGQSASTHLKWRDVAGLLPAAQALAGAGARAVGHRVEADNLFDAVAPTAAQDPKVVMLRTWSDAWQARSDGRREDAARALVDGARWLLAAQHTYFAGMLAHCAVRAGVHLIGPSSTTEAVAVIAEAHHIAGGGLLNLFARHGEATIAGDAATLGRIAGQARELGIATTAADTLLMLRRGLHGKQLPEATARRVRASVDELRAQTPAMALWAPTG